MLKKIYYLGLFLFLFGLVFIIGYLNTLLIDWNPYIGYGTAVSLIGLLLAILTAPKKKKG